MAQRGKITTWNDEKGFGFITPNEGGTTLFFHISELAGGQPRPVGNEIVTYDVAADERGRPQAVKIYFGMVRPSSLVNFGLDAIAVGFFIASVALSIWGFLSFWIPLSYLVISLLTFAIYGKDKERAVKGKGQRRTPEKILHLLELIGGWPGALIAQQYYRHKNKKLSYQIIYWLIVAFHLGFWGWFFGLVPLQMNIPNTRITEALQSIRQGVLAKFTRLPATREPTPATLNKGDAPKQEKASQSPGDSKRVQTEIVGGRKKKSYTVTLQSGEIIVGHADSFQTVHAQAAFLLVGPGKFQFSIENGVWYKWTRTTPPVNDRLLQEQKDLLITQKHLAPTAIDTVRLP